MLYIQGSGDVERSKNLLIKCSVRRHVTVNMSHGPAMYL